MAQLTPQLNLDDREAVEGRQQAKSRAKADLDRNCWVNVGIADLIEFPVDLREVCGHIYSDHCKAKSCILRRKCWIHSGCKSGQDDSNRCQMVQDGARWCKLSQGASLPICCCQLGSRSSGQGKSCDCYCHHWRWWRNTFKFLSIFDNDVLGSQEQSILLHFHVNFLY